MAIRITIKKEGMLKLRDDCTVKVGKKKGTLYTFGFPDGQDEGDPFIDGLVKYTKTKGELATICTRFPVDLDGNPRFIVPFWIGIDLVGRLKPLVAPVDFKLSIVLRDHQVVDMRQIIDHLVKKACSLFIARPGYGKTVMYMWTISVIRQRTLIIVPSKINLAVQTKKALSDYIDNPNRIGILETDGVIQPEWDILIAMVGRLGKLAHLLMPTTTATTTLTRGAQASELIKVTMDRFPFVILDEVHMLTSEFNMCGLLNTRPLRVAAFTATPGNREGITNLFVGNEAIIGSNIKPWTACFPRIRTGIDFAKLEATVTESVAEDGQSFSTTT